MKTVAIGTAKVMVLFCAAIIGMHVARLVMIDEEWIFGVLIVAGIIYLNFGQKAAE